MKATFRKSSRYVLGLTLSVLLFGCQTLEVKPTLHDEVLMFNRAYDYTFLRTMEALMTFPTWILEVTDKEAGLIIIRNTEYSHMFDRDFQTLRFQVNRVSRTKTSVQLVGESQEMEMGPQFLERIDSMVVERMVDSPKQLAEAAFT
jgi:hypothetical protein